MSRCKNFFAASAAELKNIRSLTLAALLAAIYAVSYSPLAGNIVIVPGLFEFRFGFLAIALAGMLCGPVCAMLVGVIGDFFGTILFYGGSFFFGYTVSWVLMGLIFGCFLYKERMNIARVIGAMLVHTVAIDLLLTTYWQSVLGYGTFEALFASRLVIKSVMMPVNTVLLIIVLRAVTAIYRRIGAARA